MTATDTEIKIDATNAKTASGAAEPLLSVIVPVWNDEKYLQQCVDSILASDYSNLELLLVDDGSTDRSGEMCDEYARKDKRVRAMHQKNAGTGEARNNGLRNAHGEWVTFVDNDDWIEPDMYSTLIEAARKHGVRIAGCPNFNEREDGTWFNNYSDIPDGPVAGRRCNLDILYQTRHAWGVVWNKVFHRSLLDGVTFPNTALEDYIVMLPLNQKAGTIWFHATPLYHHRIRRGSQSAGGRTAAQELKVIDAAEALRHSLADGGADPEIMAGADSFVFRTYAGTLWKIRKNKPGNYKAAIRQRRPAARHALRRYLRHSRKQKADLTLVTQILLAIL